MTSQNENRSKQTPAHRRTVSVVRAEVNNTRTTPDLLVQVKPNWHLPDARSNIVQRSEHPLRSAKDRTRPGDLTAPPYDGVFLTGNKK
jgi:hypothetical protein